MPKMPQPGAGSKAQWGAVVETMRVAVRTASARVVEEELTGALGPLCHYAVLPRATNASAPAFAGSGSATYVVPSPCTRRNPTVSVSPAMQQGAPGVTVTYGVSVTNNDTACGTTSLNQKATVPSGWTGTFASSAPSIASGATASTTLYALRASFGDTWTTSGAGSTCWARAASGSETPGTGSSSRT